MIFPRKSLRDFIECNVLLKYVNVNPRYEIDHLPGGYTGVCLLEFDNGEPDFFNKLAFYGETKDSTIHDTLILTQKEILNEIKGI